MRVAAVVPVVLAGLALAACSDTTESSLTKADVIKKLTVNPPPAGLRRLLSATCEETEKNRYTCSVETDEKRRAKLDVRADGDDIRIISARNE
ncbi:hypothetical protein [Patulibacter minatonensis]|uniref:hypothetical protein n=1 Tax=Patulibacter minatonensis TaxID=298163 RepID=UPI000478B64A|nr:hypothetical protein [Patulibacter minatonensis]